MKTKVLFAALISMLMAAGCSLVDKDMIAGSFIDNLNGKEMVIITASVDDRSDAATKTILNSQGKVEWTPGEEIMVFSDGESAKFTSLNTENVRFARFRGMISFVTGATEGSEPEAFVYGLYPYDADATMSAGVITTTLPSVQEGFAGSFGDNIALAAAKSVSTNLSFKNAYSGIDFEFSEEGYQSVTLSSNNGEPIAGTVAISFGADGLPATEVVANGSSSITLNAPGGGAFEAGKRYYIICAPQTMSGGFTLTAQRPEGRAVFTVTSNQEFRRNVLKDISGNLDERAVFESSNIVFADDAVKAICVAHWDTNEDGELSYSEAAAVQGALPDGIFSGTEITSFDEFQYFTGVTSLGYTTDGPYDEGYDYIGAFDGCRSLQSIVLPPSLRDISINAFYFCTSLESITIPATVTRIGMSAFAGCTNLTVTMESETPCTLYIDMYESCGAGVSNVFGGYQTRVKSILVPTDESVTAYQSAQYWSDYAFLIHKVGWVNPASFITFKDAIVELYCVDQWDTNGDGHLSMTEAAAVTDIGTTFKGVDITSFDELKYFTGISTIPAEAFRGCSLLESLSFPPQITSIGANAFSGNAKLKKINVPSLDLWMDVVCTARPFYSTDGDLYINDNLVTEISVPNGRTTISDYFAYRLSKLETVIIPNSVTSIGQYAFYGCTGLAAIDIPSGVSSIGQYAFYGRTVNSVPESATSIGQYAFQGCVITSSTINLPSVSSIGAYAFKDCSSLEYVNLPQTVPYNYSIGSGAFMNCTGLRSFVFPYCTGTYAIVVHDSTFEGCTGLQSFTFSGEVRRIGKRAFYGCSALKSLSVIGTANENGGTTIEEYAFAGCSALETVDIEGNFSGIYRNAFSGVSASLVRLPSTIQTLCTRENMTGGTTIKYNIYGAFLGSSIETIEVHSSSLECIREGFINLTYPSTQSSSPTTNTIEGVPRNIIVLKDEITYTLPIGAFQNLVGLESITLPNGLTSIGHYAFSGLSTLASIELPNTLKVIGNEAFYRSGLTSIIIPSGVTSIGTSAFYGCNTLTSIQINPTVPPTGGASMFNTDVSVPIYVPAGSVEAYKTAENWSTYADRIQAIPVN